MAVTRAVTQPPPKVHALGRDRHHLLHDFEGLEEVVLFPGADSEPIPNGSAWIFAEQASYEPEILENDVGCGMSAFYIERLDDEKRQRAADAAARIIQETGAFGRGNHFVDFCTDLTFIEQETDSDLDILLIHSDMSADKRSPATLEDAQARTRTASERRYDLAERIARAGAFTLYESMGDWPHSTIEVRGDGKHVYRKGLVRAEENRLYALPAGIGQPIILYTLHSGRTPPAHSMPHATGRSGRRGATKVSIEHAREIRESVYVPQTIRDASLRTEHPSCFASFDAIFEHLSRYMVPQGEMRIAAYIGKI